MIVIGLLAPDPGGPDARVAIEIARRAAAAGARVEMLGAAAPGAAGDAHLIELASAGIGHATVTRTGADSLEAADLDLALRYLPDVRAVLLVRPPSGLLPTALALAAWSGASLVLIGPLDATALAVVDGAPEAPVVLDPPGADPDGTFAGFAAALAARLDEGEAPEAAFRATVRMLAADPA